MLRASIRSAIKKYKIHIDLKVSSGDLSSSIFDSEMVHIENALKIIDFPNHHKMMRKELTMNIFPFGNDGTDPSMIIKLVRNEHLISFDNLFKKSIISKSVICYS